MLTDAGIGRQPPLGRSTGIVIPEGRHREAVEVAGVVGGQHSVDSTASAGPDFDHVVILLYDVGIHQWNVSTSAA